ncbi:hypothetical protein A4A49_65045, partial [Nicotiana attenuata]
LRRSFRPSKTPIWLTDYVVQPMKSTVPYPVSQHISYNQSPSDYRASLAAYSAIVEPRTFKEASVYPNWIEAMQAEVSALQDNNTWSLVNVPQGKVPIGCK